ncbi:MAG TPA: hypothetical protein PL048_19315 [Leptospiraceae bacterium]|nr:hypothetical protein [Leptospiraceae bacterium]HMY66146.1 hypothetical protein [Leptospiraceae bacterium]HMZ60935.1 hypothetical protein [Leptospiraceae bacterium]HNF12884.1 hypothetical protein [Leptospiraceae bacterium]HNF23788.1 hypothetical protein [Leptospiraceae bacterium]
MKAIETIMDVTETGDFLLPISQELKPGRYKVVLVVDEDSSRGRFSYHG